MNMLPSLPRINKKQEATSSLKLRKWLMDNPRSSCSIEMKDTRGKNYLSFSEVKEEQLTYAMAIKGDKGVLIRIQGVNGEPDYIYLRNEPAYIVIKYPKCMVGIDPQTFMLERDRSKSRSLLCARAKDIAVFVIPN